MNQSGVLIQTMQPAQWSEVALLIHDSTNRWYESRGLPRIFNSGPESTLLFCEVYEALDPDCCLIAIDKPTGQIVGSCFYHPRETHVSIGIMNVHPGHFGRGIASSLLAEVLSRAKAGDRPVRLVSSAMNLDSFSLYNRAGFRPVAVYQDMLISVPPGGLNVSPPELVDTVRPASAKDVEAMADLEMDLAGIRRKNDFRFFVENETGIWNTLVSEDSNGNLTGFLCAVRHPASNMIGPGVAGGAQGALALIYRMLDFHLDNTAVLLVPSNCGELLATLYDWGARNCEIHFAQVWGEAPEATGIVFPTFMPETG